VRSARQTGTFKAGNLEVAGFVYSQEQLNRDPDADNPLEHFANTEADGQYFPL